eukprot:9250581-Lingulodinium_polyedra.AAC.1
MPMLGLLLARPAPPVSRGSVGCRAVPVVALAVRVGILALCRAHLLVLSRPVAVPSHVAHRSLRR